MYFISAGMLIGSGFLFVLFSDSTEQHWNKFKKEDSGDNEVKLQYSKVPLEEFSANEKRRSSTQLIN